MPLSSTLIAAIPLAIWIYLFLARGNFWRLREDAIEPRQLENWPRVTAIVPARNEAETIARAIASLAEQDYPGEFSVIVVDDHSEDDTTALARQAARAPGVARWITIHRATELPPGWTGKLWALNEGVRTAAADAPAFFWFTDADIVHAPDTLRRLVFRAEKESLDLASLMVLLRAKTIPERLLVPPFLFFFLMLYPPRWIADANSRTAGAAGGCILLRRGALGRIGRVAAIRGEVIDDCSLASAVKKSGGRIWMGLTRKSVSLRRYDGFHELRDMIARTAFTQLNYSLLQLVGTLVGLLLTFVAPVALALSTNSKIWLSALLAWCLMSASFLPTVVFYRLSPVWSPFLPIAAVFYAYATFLSAVRFWIGRGGQWKGRAQAQKT